MVLDKGEQVGLGKPIDAKVFTEAQRKLVIEVQGNWEVKYMRIYRHLCLKYVPVMKVKFNCLLIKAKQMVADELISENERSFEEENKNLSLMKFAPNLTNDGKAMYEDRKRNLT